MDSVAKIRERLFPVRIDNIPIDKVH